MALEDPNLGGVQDPGGQQSAAAPSYDPSQGAPQPSQPSSPVGGGGAGVGQQVGGGGGDFRGALSGYGIDTSHFQSDEQARQYYSRLTPQYVSEMYQRSQWAERMLPYYRQMQAQQGQATAQPQQAVGAQPAQTAAVKEPYWPKAPEWNNEYLDRLTVGADGRVHVLIVRGALGQRPQIRPVRLH